VIEEAISPETRSDLVAQSVLAYETGIFGVPSFVGHGEIFFGADRLDMLAWRLEQQSNQSNGAPHLGATGSRSMVKPA